jgi:hypothetical protein
MASIEEYAKKRIEREKARKIALEKAALEQEERKNTTTKKCERKTIDRQEQCGCCRFWYVDYCYQIFFTN